MESKNAEMPIHGAVLSLSQQVSQVASLQQSLLEQMNSQRPAARGSAQVSVNAENSNQPEEPTLREVMSLFLLSLAPFIGVLVGAGLLQLIFGWDAAPVYHAFLCAAVAYVLYQQNGGRDPLQPHKTVDGHSPLPSARNVVRGDDATASTPVAVKERFNALRALLEDDDNQSIGPSQINILDACLEFVAAAKQQSMPVGCPPEKVEHESKVEGTLETRHPESDFSAPSSSISGAIAPQDNDHNDGPDGHDGHDDGLDSHDSQNVSPDSHGGHNDGPDDRNDSQNDGPDSHDGHNDGPDSHDGHNDGPDSHDGHNDGPGSHDGHNDGPDSHDGHNDGPDDTGGSDSRVAEVYREAEKLTRAKRFAEVPSLLITQLPSPQAQWGCKANRVWGTAKMQQSLRLMKRAQRKQGPRLDEKEVVALMTDARTALEKAKTQNPKCPLCLLWYATSNMMLVAKTGGVKDKIAAGQQFHSELQAALELLDQGHFERPDNADEDEAAAVEQRIRSFAHFLLAAYYYEAANLPWALRMAAQAVVTLPTMQQAVEVYEVSFRESTERDSKKEKAYKIARIYAKHIGNQALADKWKREAARCVDPDPEENDWFNEQINTL